MTGIFKKPAIKLQRIYLILFIAFLVWKFEKGIFRYFAEGVPSILLVLEGGAETIDTVSGACKKGIPVVLINNSGKVADVLAYGYQNLSEEFIKDHQAEHEGLMSVIKENFPELKSSDSSIMEKKYKDLYEKIITCLRQKRYVSWQVEFYYWYC